MREWLLVVAPLGFVIYFLVFPGQLGPALDWVKSATQLVLDTL
jgi:hypothetical protein